MTWSIKKFLEETSHQFAGEPEQKAGDQVRGTEQPKKTDVEPGTPYKKHPFQGRLVGGSESVDRDGLDQQLLDEFEQFMVNNADDDFDDPNYPAPDEPLNRDDDFDDPDYPAEPVEEAPVIPGIATGGTAVASKTPPSPQEVQQQKRTQTAIDTALRPLNVKTQQLNQPAMQQKVGQGIAQAAAKDPKLVPAIQKALQTSVKP